MQILLLGLEVFPVSLVLTLMLTQIILPRLVRAHAGQMILEIGPSWHKSKEGTPTMGGIAPIFAVILTTSLFALVLRRQTHEDLSPWLLTLLFALANASVGIIDDDKTPTCTKPRTVTPTETDSAVRNRRGISGAPAYLRYLPNDSRTSFFGAPSADGILLVSLLLPCNFVVRQLR